MRSLYGSFTCIVGAVIAFLIAQPANSEDVLLAMPHDVPKVSRQELCTPRQDWISLPYLDESSLRGSSGSGLAASLTFLPKLPTLVLEHIADSLSAVECTFSSVHLRFLDAAAFIEAQIAWHDLASFYIITSHKGCNEHGHRVPFEVLRQIHLEEQLSIILSVEQASWHRISHTTTLEFGTKIRTALLKDKSVYRHNDLHKRQSGSSKTSIESAPASSSTPPVRPGLNIPLNSSIINKAILPPAIDLGPVSITSVDGVVFKCANCSTFGSLELTYGKVTMNQTLNVTSDVGFFEFFQEGFLEVIAHNLGAHIYLETDGNSTNGRQKNWQAAMPSFALTPFQIPGVLAIGPMFTPKIAGFISIQDTLQFRYGFEVLVPDQSALVINIANSSGSGSKGFQDTTLKALPFTSNISAPVLDFQAGFRPTLSLGVSILGGYVGSASAGFFVDLPAVKINVSQVSGVDKQCQPVSPNTKTDPALGLFNYNLTSIVPSVNIDGGINFEVTIIKIIPLVNINLILFSKNLTNFPTQCLSWNAKSSTLGPIAAKNTGQPNPPDYTDPASTSAKKASDSTKLSWAHSHLALLTAILIIYLHL